MKHCCVALLYDIPMGSINCVLYKGKGNVKWSTYNVRNAAQKYNVQECDACEVDKRNIAGFKKIFSFIKRKFKK